MNTPGKTFARLG